MKTKGRLFWTRLLTMMALCIAALIAGLSFGMTSAYAENADKAASSEDGGVSVLALPEGVTVTGITGVVLTGTVTTASSYADIKAALAVTARGSDGETYKLDPDECLMLILGNLIADILYGVCDPRIKQGVGSDAD